MTLVIDIVLSFFFLMRRRPPRSTRTDTSFPTRRSSDLHQLDTVLLVGALVMLAARMVGDQVVDRLHESVKVIGQKSGASVDNRLRERSEEHTSELQSLMRISYAVFCLKKNTYT